MTNPTYTGPATLEYLDTSIPCDVSLDEHAPTAVGLGTWEAEADISLDYHGAFHAIWLDGKGATLKLGDGRSGTVLVADVLMRPDHVSALLRGNGPAPV